VTQGCSYRDVDDAFALTATAGAALKDSRTGTNIRHSLTALLRQSIYSRLAGYGQGSRIHQSDGPLRA